MNPTESLFQSALEALVAEHLLREPDGIRLRSEAEAAASAAGLPFIDASSNDYLGLARAIVSRETLNALEGLLPGAGASRLIHGSRPAHEHLESELAAWVRLPQALLFASGYAANVGLMGAVGSPGSLIVSDALNHASIIDGCRLSKALVRVVPHLDLDAIEKALREHVEGPRWVVTESYFSMDGDGPDLARLAPLCVRYGAGLIVDEAHALGVFGPEGAGRCAEAGVQPDILVGTLGKSVGLHGAFVAGSARLREFLWNRARSFVFSTAPSPLLSVLGALHVKRARSDERLREQLRARWEQLRSELQEFGVKTLVGSFGPIVPILTGPNERALEAANELRALGVLTQGIRPPTVPEGTARLRVTVTASLAEGDVRRLATALGQVTRARPTGTAAPTPQAARPASRRIVVLGTGTSVGKTRVAAALAQRLAGGGGQVLALKPVESGVAPGTIGEDVTRLAAAAGHPVPSGSWQLREPLSPHLAAERERQQLDLAAIAHWVDLQEHRAKGANDDTSPYVVIETAGGVFSPLTTNQTNFELASAVGPATWVLVAPDSLGVLHEVTATLEAMAARGHAPDYLVLSAARSPDPSTGTNAAELGRIGLLPPVAVLARDDDSGIAALVAALLAPPKR